MKTLVKNIIYWVLSFFPSRGVVVLMYHSVSENGKLFTVTPADFTRHMEHLSKHHFRVVGLGEALASVRQRRISKKTVVITFDDGYQDNYLNAFPVLKKYRLPATIFVSTAFIGSGTTQQGVATDILSQEQIQEMSKSGLIAFGSHAHHHVKLAQLPLEKIKDELAISKKILEGITGTPVDVFAYPYGNFDERVKKNVARHYRFALSITKGSMTAFSDILALPRNSIDSKVTFAQFKGIARFGRI